MLILRQIRALTALVWLFPFTLQLGTAQAGPAAPAFVTPAFPAAAVDADVERAMREFHVPGAAVGIIVDGHVVFAKGYGVRRVGSPEPVDADTLFDVGSITKSFTAMGVAAMVDDGKLEFDKPVIQYLPAFRLYDPVATQLITPRDLLGHRSGLPRHDFIRQSTWLTREQFIDRLRYLEPNHTFREVFQYNNLMYVVAGYLAGHANGTSWEELVSQRIFTPLGMTHSNTSAREIQQTSDFASPHDVVGDKPVVIPFYDYQRFGIGPNGAVNSSVDDMLKYLAFHMGDGTANGKKVLSPAQFWQIHDPITVVPCGPACRAESSDNSRSYAMGWFVGSAGGHRLLYHGGNINGFSAQMSLVPDMHTAIVVLNNVDSALPYVIANDFIDRELGLPAVDRVELIKKEIAADRRRDEDALKAFEAARLPKAPASLPLAAYAGDWFHPAFGTVHVAVDGEALAVRFDALTLHLTHYNYDTFAISNWNNGEIAAFHLDGEGKPSELLLPLEPAVKPFVFTRKH
jgi:CubicO group peptidase (beta-lactamase class C family)